MTIFTLIVFLLATIRTLKPLGNKENWTVGNIIFAACHIIAFKYLCEQFLVLKQ